MSAKLEAEQIVKAQRYFAIACNNNACPLAELSDAATRCDELLNLAHASAFQRTRPSFSPLLSMFRVLAEPRFCF